MIQPEIRERYRTVLGNNYGKTVKSILTERGITNRKGKAYDDSMISQVLNGKRKNAAIEDAFSAAYKAALEGTKKPEAVTPG